MRSNMRNSQNIQKVVICLLIGISNGAKAQSAAGNTAADSTGILVEALQLIHSPEPTFQPNQNQEIDPAYLAELGFAQVYPNVPQTFAMRDGKNLFAYKYPREGSRTTIILLHGVLSGAYLMNKTAGLLRETTGAEVFALDFRGHGQSGGKPGDVDYIDQYAVDIADVITIIKKEKPNGKIILAGHSMGGGIALRYAMKENAPAVDGYLLFAPLLGHDSPTIPTAPRKDKKNDEEDFLKIHIPRIIGLKMLNSIGEHKYDSLSVLFFSMPKEMPLKNYSYRANESMTPADYKTGLGAVKEPLLVLVGSKDEAFVATEFEPVVTKYSHGDIFVIEEASHNGIRHHQKAMQRIKAWTTKHQL